MLKSDRKKNVFKNFDEYLKPLNYTSILTINSLYL